MTLKEAAAFLGVTAANLRQAIARGSLKAQKMGRDWHVTAKEVERYRRESRRESQRPTDGADIGILRGIYEDHGLAETAREYGVSRQTILRWLDAFGITR